MSRTTLNNGDSGLAVRTALNTMFAELYAPAARIASLATVGDSFNAYGYSNTNGSLLNGVYKGANSPWEWVCVLSGGRLEYRFENQFSVAGKRTDEIDGQITAAIASAATIVSYHCGTNDLLQAIATATIITKITSHVEALIAAGKLVLLCAVTPQTENNPYGTSLATFQKGMMEVNRAIRSIAATHNNCILVDAVADLTDPASASGYPIGGSGGATTGVTVDGRHWAPRGAYIAGRKAFTALDKLLPPRDLLMQNQLDVYDAVVNTKGNFVPNGILAGTTGTKGTGGSGNVATSWDIAREIGANATIVGAKTTKTRTDGGAAYVRQQLTIACSGGSDPEQCRMRQIIDAGANTFAIGDTVKYSMAIELTDVTGLVHVYAEVQELDSGSVLLRSYRSLSAVSFSADYCRYPLETWSGVFELPEIVVGASGAKHRVALAFGVEGAAANVVALVDRITGRNLSK